MPTHAVRRALPAGPPVLGATGSLRCACPNEVATASATGAGSRSSETPRNDIAGTYWPNLSATCELGADAPPSRDYRPCPPARYAAQGGADEGGSMTETLGAYVPPLVVVGTDG